MQMSPASDPITETLLAILGNDEVASLAGLGLFARERLAGASGTNPRTGQVISVAPRVMVQFRPTSSLRGTDRAAAEELAEVPAVDLTLRSSERLRLSLDDANKLVEAWVAPKVREITSFTEADADDERLVSLGSFGVLRVRWHRVPEHARSLVGASRRRFVFRPSRETIEALGLVPDR